MTDIPLITKINITTIENRKSTALHRLAKRQEMRINTKRSLDLKISAMPL